jgi:hypothetical protein
MDTENTADCKIRSFWCFGYDVLDWKHKNTSVISGFRRHVEEICALLGCYAELSGKLSPTFQDNVSVPSS